MARNGHDVHHAISKIVLRDFCRPGLEAEEPHDCFWLRLDYTGGGSASERSVPRCMVSVTVRVDDENWQRVCPLWRLGAQQVSKYFRNVGTRCTGVDQQGFLRSEKQVEKRLLEMRTPGLPQNEESGVVLVHTKRRRVLAVRSLISPSRWQNTTLEA